MQTVSIIICTWNRADSLCASLATLERQQLPPDTAVEVLVVDNNSSDHTATAVGELAARWRLGSLRYLFEGRQGKQFALNTGIRASSGALLAFSDDDIVFPADWVASIVAAFADPALELAGGKTLVGWPAGGPPAWYDPQMAAIVGGVDLGPARLAPPPAGYAPAGGNLAARKSLFDKVGLFSEAHFRHMDYEFGMRAAARGAVIAYEPTLSVEAPVDPAMVSRRYFRRWSLKAGILHDSAADPHEAKLLYVPRWVYRRLLQDCLAWPGERLTAGAATAFQRELRIWRWAGTIASCWHAQLRPDKHTQWVASYAQKKKNVY